MIGQPDSRWHSYENPPINKAVSVWPAPYCAEARATAELPPEDPATEYLMLIGSEERNCELVWSSLTARDLPGARSTIWGNLGAGGLSFG
jgi:hypothetical protein